MTFAKSFHRQAVIYTIIVIAVFLCLFPLFYLFLTSVKPPNLAMETPPRIIFRPSFEHYRRILVETGYYKFYLNSLIIALGATLIAVLLGTFAAFAFAKFEFRGSKMAFFLILIIRMYMPVTTLIPIYLVARYLRLLDTRIYLIIVYASFQIPLIVFIMRNFFSNIPVQIQESAELDGCGPIGLFFRIVLPMSTNGLFASMILAFMFSWNEFLFALILTSIEARTAPVAMSAFTETEGALFWGELSTLALCMTIPVIFFMILFKRFLIKGMVAGAIKG